MENATKALLMAAVMLLVVMLASIFAVMFSTMSEYSKSYDERLQTEELQAFNMQFEKYLQYNEDGTQVGATAQDIVTVINLAKSYNEKMGYEKTDTEYYINVEIEGETSALNTFDKIDVNNFLKLNSTYTSGGVETIKKYKINIEKSNLTGKVNKISFENP